MKAQILPYLIRNQKYFYKNIYFIQIKKTPRSWQWKEVYGIVNQG
jgi:hypothetical protein